MEIWKYAIKNEEEVGFRINNCYSIQMPKGAKVLTVQAQKDCPYLWAMVDPEAPLEARKFRTTGTGVTIAEKDIFQTYIGTIQLVRGDFIVHVFEL